MLENNHASIIGFLTHLNTKKLNDKGVKYTYLGFICPCLSSANNKKDEVLPPLAMRVLDLFPIIISKVKILVDLNIPIKRKFFDKSQITYA